MKDWTYGGFAKKYDMTAEKIEIGTGTVKVHDLMQPIPEWLTGEVLFCDPPCSQANLQAFATKADKGALANNEYKLFEERLAAIFDKIAPKYIYLEVFQSNKVFWVGYLLQRFKYVDMGDSYYYKKKTNRCWILAASNDDYHIPLAYQDESDDIKDICRRSPKELTICDPCMGMGLVGYWANYYGRKFTGTELNPHRLAYMIERINQGRLVPKKDLDQVKNKG